MLHALLDAAAMRARAVFVYGIAMVRFDARQRFLLFERLLSLGGHSTRKGITRTRSRIPIPFNGRREACRRARESSELQPSFSEVIVPDTAIAQSVELDRGNAAFG